MDTVMVEYGRSPDGSNSMTQDTTPSSRDAAIPARMVLVPVKPDEAMLRAGIDETGDPEGALAVWRAMLAAAPKPPIVSNVASPSTGQAGVERLREALERILCDGNVGCAAAERKDRCQEIARAALAPLPSLSGSEVVASTTASVDIPAGMKPWSGGGRAPDDWDGGPVLFRSRQMSVESPAWRWDWGKPPHSYDIIAYTPQEDAPISGFEAREWLVSQEAQADQLPGKLLYTGQQMIAAFAAGRSGEVERARECAGRVFDERAKRASHPATVTMERHHAKVIRQGEGDDYDAVQAALYALAAIDPAQQGVGK